MVETGNPSFFDVVEVNASNPWVEAARPANFNMISKRGSDGIHGFIYYKRSESNWNSRPFFDVTKASYHLSDLDGELGGAVIPKWTYFYGGAMWSKTPYNQVLYADVPTAQMRNGDFSQFLNPATAPGGKTVVVRDPRTGQPFPNNAIPASRFAGVSKIFVTNYFPAPNVGDANTFTQNYSWNHPFGPQSFQGVWPFGRIDQKISSGNQAYFRWLQNQTAAVPAGTVSEQLSSTQSPRLRSMVASDVHEFSTSLVNDATFGMTGLQVKQGEAEKKFNPTTGDSVVTAVGLQGVNPNAISVMGFPTETIAGMSGLVMPLGGGFDKEVALADRTIRFQDTVAWNLGRHTFRIGGEHLHLSSLQGAVPQDVYGSFDFTGAFTGNAFADFLLGIPATATRQQIKTDRKLDQASSGAFLSDSFRVSSRFTLDFGLRWDYYEAPTFEDGFMANWNPTTGNVIVAPGTVTSVSTFYPKNIGITVGNPVPRTKTTNFRPRVAAAYRISENMVVRGGYGQFTEFEGYGLNGRLNSWGPWFLTETYTNSIVGGAPVLSFPKPFPASPSTTVIPSQTVVALPSTTDEGTYHQYNFTVERMTRGLGLRAAFIGARGKNLNYAVDINKPQASSTPFTNARKPYPQFANAFVVRNDGQWHYDSVFVEAQKRSGPVTFTSNLTLANNVANYLDTTDPYNVTNKWVRDPADRRRYWVNSAIWNLPLRNDSQLLGHWTLAAVATFASGQYYSPLYTGPDPANASPGFVTELPDCVGNPNTGARTISQWFNPAAFAVPPATAGRYGACGMNSLEGYPIHVGHVSVTKTFPFGDTLKLVFTAQISNITNSAHFTFPNNNISNPNPGAFTAASLTTLDPERTAFRTIDLKLRLQW